MHPGWSDTEGVRSSIPAFHKAFQDKLRDTQQGVDTILWLALEVCVHLLRSLCGGTVRQLSWCSRPGIGVSSRHSGSVDDGSNRK
jgi:hypothetical protein